MMNNDTKINKIQEALEMLYAEANTVFPRPIQWKELNTKEVADCMQGSPSLWSAFYVPKERFDKVINSLTRGCRYSWRWPRKTQIDGTTGEIIPDPEWDEYIGEYDIMAAKLEKKVITRKEFNKWQAEAAKKYGMQKRNYDRESISFNVWNFGPSCDEDSFLKLKRAYQLHVVNGMPLEEAADKAFKKRTFEEEYDLRNQIAANWENKDTEYLDRDNIMSEVNRYNEDHKQRMMELINQLKSVWEVVSKNK